MTSYDMLDNSKDFQQILHEVLNSRLKSKTKQEILLQDILKRSDKTSTIDFQEMLKKSIKPLSEDRIKKDLEPKIKKVDDKSRKLNIGEQVKSGADLDKISSDEEEKDEDTLITNSNDALTKKEETLKYMYSAALDEYYKLRENLYKDQIKDGNIAVDDKNYLKLLKYETYIRKCDVLFKQNNGSYISNQDENISKKENKYAYDAAKSETKVVNQHQDSINEIDRLNGEIENKAEEIMQINEAVKTGNVSDYETKIELLQNDYIELNAKMHMLKPNILELYRQEEQKEQQEKDTTRIVGTMYEKKKEKLILDKDVVRLDRKIDKRDESLEDSAKDEKDELVNTNINLANSYIEAAEIALDKNDADEALFMINKAKKIVGNQQVEILAYDKNLDFSEVLKNNVSSGNESAISQNISSETEAIDTHLSDVSNKSIDLSNVQQECAKAVHTPEERGKNALAREKLEKNQKEKIKDIEISR